MCGRAIEIPACPPPMRPNELAAADAQWYPQQYPRTFFREDAGDKYIRQQREIDAICRERSRPRWLRWLF